MKVLVTGAAGRVGANVVRRLASRGHLVSAMIAPGDSLVSKIESLNNVHIFEGDLQDQSAIDDAAEGVTHVVHLAAQLIRGSTPVDKFYDVNALGTLRVLEAALRRGDDGIERFVLASSDGTYRPADPPEIPMKEDSPQRPADYYGTSKLLGEVILRNHGEQFDIPYSIVRFATVVSPEEAGGIFRVSAMRSFLGWQALGRDSHVWPLFVGQDRLLPIFEEQVADASDEDAVALVDPAGEPWTLHMVDVRDAVQGVCRALTEPRAVGQAFNIAAALPTSHREGMNLIADEYGVRRFEVELPLRWQLELSIKAAREMIGFDPKYTFSETLKNGVSAQAEFSDSYIPAGSASGVGSL